VLILIFEGWMEKAEATDSLADRVWGKNNGSSNYGKWSADI
jgi:hypothetical protein